MNVQAEAGFGESYPKLWVMFTTPKGATEVKANILPRPGKGSKLTTWGSSTRANLSHFLSAFVCQGVTGFLRAVPHHCPSPTTTFPWRSAQKVCYIPLPVFPRNTPFRQFIMTFCPDLSGQWTKGQTKHKLNLQQGTLLHPHLLLHTDTSFILLW